MPPERTPRQRQDPVSCESCRKKKLKCDRQQPCANCQARGLQCHFQGGPPPSRNPLQTTQNDFNLQQEDAILARLQRLEDAVFNRRDSQILYPPVNGFSTTDRPARAGSVRNNEILTTSVTQSTPRDDHQVKMYSEDSRWLEEQGTRGFPSLPQLSGKPTIRVESVHSIVRTIGRESDSRSIALPTYDEAVHLLDCYLAHVDTLQHIIYIPHVRVMIMTMYTCLSGNGEERCSNIALLLAILATIVSYWGIGECGASVFESRAEAQNMGRYWIRCTLDVLSHAWRTESPDIPMVQVCMLLVFLLFQLEGYSAKLKVIHMTGISCAREMGLHLTDSLRSKRREDTQGQIIENEIRRRIWWHLCSTDWSSSLVGGPSEGVYCIDPRHAKVKKPRNITDEDLATKRADFDRPLSEVTSNSYYIQRIRLGEVCKEVADITWELAEVADPEQISYERILWLDAKFEQLLDLPQMLRVDGASSLADSADYGSFPQLAKQKYFNYITIMVRRAKLHFPFLIRAEQDPRYAFSRETCLRCARSILQFKDILPSEDPKSVGHLKLLGVIHHFFIAVVVLAMDLCVNRASGDVQARNREVQEACKIFEVARASSFGAETFLESLLSILRKHRIQLQQQEAVQKPGTDGYNGQPTTCGGSAQWQSQSGQGVAEFDAASLQDLDFGDVWQTYFDFGTNANPADWDALFSDLDVRLD